MFCLELSLSQIQPVHQHVLDLWYLSLCPKTCPPLCGMFPRHCPADNLHLVISLCPSGCVWRWGWYEAGKSSCGRAGCGTRRCWSGSSWGAGCHERAPSSRVRSVDGPDFPSCLYVGRWSLVPLQERQRRWDRGGPAPSHHHDAPPCDPAHPCTWRRREEHVQQGDTSTWELYN